MAEERHPPKPQPHRLTLVRRADLELSGIQKVESFDDKEIVLLTSEGRLNVRGENLHIRHLDLESGACMLDGSIVALLYAQDGKSGGGWLKRLAR